MAVKVGAAAIPVAFVTAVAVIDPPKVPLAPLAGAVNVTVAPATGVFAEFFTVACRAVPKAVPAVALCGVPPVALTEIVSGAVFVSKKAPLPVAPGAVATTK